MTYLLAGFLLVSTVGSCACSVSLITYQLFYYLSCFFKQHSYVKSSCYFLHS